MINPQMAPPALRATVFLLSLIVIGWLLFSFRTGIGNALLPLLNTVVSLLERQYDIAEFNIIRKRNEFVYHLRLVSEGPIVLYGHRLPGMDVSATTLVTHSLQQIFIISAALLAGLLFCPVYGLRLTLLMAAALIPALALDIPFVLLGSIEGLILQNLAPHKLDGSWLVQWEKILTNGGRMAIAIGLSALALGLARKPDPGAAVADPG